ncbi:cell division protein FtsQ/DivIB [Streptococcus suis]|uniref:cell division protein FtsQ/DivIB n=1 Tax=Streptococcus suis TaxID=1307 RepID=UPI001ABE60AD|nr:FtsQ-type POTRA domain-containing protein [Streptococcus suis]
MKDREDQKVMEEQESILFEEEVQTESVEQGSEEAGKPESTEDVVLEEADQKTAEEDEHQEEASQFLKSWREKHEAYLASQAQSLEAVREEVEKDSDQGQRKKRPSFFKKEKKVKEDQVSIPRKAWAKAVPIYLVAVSVVLLAAYFISPWSKQKQLKVTGQILLTAEMVKQYSLISDQDYSLTTLLHKDAYAANVEKSSNLVKTASISYQFPNQFTIDIEEYKEVGYIKQNNTYYSVLSSGKIAEIETAEENLGTDYTLMNLTDKEMIKKLAIQLDEIDQKILTNIQQVDLTPTTATVDLLTLTMYDGNKVLIPLSQISIKLPYYLTISPQLTVASVIDMEVGVYSYAL